MAGLLDFSEPGIVQPSSASDVPGGGTVPVNPDNSGLLFPMPDLRGVITGVVNSLGQTAAAGINAALQTGGLQNPAGPTPGASMLSTLGPMLPLIGIGVAAYFLLSGSTRSTVRRNPRRRRRR